MNVARLICLIIAVAVALVLGVEVVGTVNHLNDKVQVQLSKYWDTEIMMKNYMFKIYSTSESGKILKYFAECGYQSMSYSNRYTFQEITIQLDDDEYNRFEMFLTEHFIRVDIMS